MAQFELVTNALIALPLAAASAAVLAFRPRRKGTPARKPEIVQTQIILAVVGAVVMLVVGNSIARAFGILGAAGLVRYRAKIVNPKDAGVMLSTLALGLAAGVNQYAMVAFGTGFILVLLWLVESIESKTRKVFELKIDVTAPNAAKPDVEAVLRKNRAIYELRSATEEQLLYEVQIFLEKRIDGMSSAITKVLGDKIKAIEWKEKKQK